MNREVIEVSPTDTTCQKFVETLKSDYWAPIADCAGDVLTQVIDAAMQLIDAIPGIVSAFPIASIAKSLAGLPAKIGEQNFMRKTYKFLLQVGDVSPRDREKALDLIEKKGEDYAGNLLAGMLDRMDNLNKAGILANLFKSLVNGNIDADDFFRLSAMLERIPFVDIKNLPKYEEERYKPGETESLSAAGAVYQCEVGGGNAAGEGENKYRISCLGQMLLRHGLLYYGIEISNTQHTAVPVQSLRVEGQTLVVDGNF